MRPVPATVLTLLLAGCSLIPRPDNTAPRVLEPITPVAPPTPDHDAQVRDLRLAMLVTREHIGYELIHRKPSGELVRDPEWSWSTTADRYLEDALSIRVAADPSVRVVRSPASIELRITITSFEFGPAEGGGEEARIAAILEATTPDGVSRISNHATRVAVAQATEGSVATPRAEAMGSALTELAAELLDATGG